MSQRFSLDRESFEQFLAAISLFQPLQKADARKRNGEAPLLMYLLETLQAIDSGALTLQAALERVAELTLRIVGGDGAAVWLFTSEDLFCRALAGVSFEDDHIRSALRSKLQSAGAFGDDPPAKLDLARTLADCLGGFGSWLVIAILPGRQLAGGLAVYSAQSAAFTSRDFVDLRLLAGLAQYVATTSPRPVPVDDLYLPGLGTRAALGGDVDIDDRSHLATVLRERKERLTASVAGLVASAAGIARDGVLAGAQGLKKTASTIGQASTFHRPVERKTPLPPSQNPDQLKSTLWLAAQSAVSGLKSHPPSEQLSLATDRLMKRLRRIRFLALKLIGDACEQISSTWERLSRAKAAASEQFFKEAREEVGLWVEQWTTKMVKARFWASQRYAAAVSALASRRVPAQRPQTTFSGTSFSADSKNISPSSFRTANETGHSRTPLQPRVVSPGREVHLVRHHFRSAASRAGTTLRRARNVEVNWIAFRKSAPAFAVLGVIFLFVLLQIPNRKPRTSTSPGAVEVAAGSLSLASAAVASPRKPDSVPAESSHLRVTDRVTEATVAELSRYEIRNLPRAANYGDDEAALQLGMLYELGREGFPQNCAKAAEWVTKAAQNGNPAAEHNLALRYRDGDGVPANPQEADHWFRKAALHKASTADHVLAELPSQPAGSLRQ